MFDVHIQFYSHADRGRPPLLLGVHPLEALPVLLLLDPHHGQRVAEHRGDGSGGAVKQCMEGKAYY